MSEIITYKNDGVNGVYSQIKLDNGERVLISIAADEIKIFKLRFFGTIPSQVLWEFPNIFRFADLLQKNGYFDDPLDVLVKKIRGFNNIGQLEKEIRHFIKELESK